MLLSRLILLTPYSGPYEILKKNIKSTSMQLDKNDIWIIVLDNQSVGSLINLKKKFKQLIFLNYYGPKGAGYCRNFGIKFIVKKIKGQFLFMPLDGDDNLTKNAVKIIKKTMSCCKFNIVSFAHQKKWPDGTVRKICYNGIFDIDDLLRKYITPCGSTVLKINKPSKLKLFKFGLRYRANDALFFYQCIKYFKKFKCHPEVILNYNIGNVNSISGKKLKMIYFKFVCFKDFGLSNYQAMYYTFLYVLHGIRRYYFKELI